VQRLARLTLNQEILVRIQERLPVKGNATMMTKELSNIQRKIERLESITKTKAHGAGGGQKDPRVLGELAELYRRRNQIKAQAAKAAKRNGS
jgi:hypothetical protein